MNTHAFPDLTRRLNTPDTFYFVTCIFGGGIGFGNVQEATESRDTAYDAFDQAVEDGEHAVTAWMVEARAYGGWHISDITEEFETERAATLEARGIEMEQTA